MKPMTFDDFVNYYNTYNRLPLNIYVKEKNVNERYLEQRYKRYIKLLEKPVKKYVVSDYEKNIRNAQDIARKKDPDADNFYSCLTDEEKNHVLKKVNTIQDWSKIDPHHIVPRSQDKKLAVDPDNIVMIPRYIHFCIENKLDFMSEKYAGKEYVENLIARIEKKKK